MSEMLDRATLALCNLVIPIVDRDGTVIGSRRIPVQQAQRFARTVIEELRTPTHSMHKVGIHQMVDHAPIAIDIWQTMIDEALR